MIENVRLKEVEAQNEDLRKKLNFSEIHPQYVLKAAQVRGRVIGSDPNNFMSVLIIDVGKRDGIRKGMPVVTERGLVGHIRSVGTNWSKVLLIIDPSSSVAALRDSLTCSANSRAVASASFLYSIRACSIGVRSSSRRAASDRSSGDQPALSSPPARISPRAPAPRMATVGFMAPVSQAGADT